MRELEYFSHFLCRNTEFTYNLSYFIDYKIPEYKSKKKISPFVDELINTIEEVLKEEEPFLECIIEITEVITIRLRKDLKISIDYGNKFNEVNLKDGSHSIKMKIIKN